MAEHDQGQQRIALWQEIITHGEWWPKDIDVERDGAALREVLRLEKMDKLVLR